MNEPYSHLTDPLRNRRMTASNVGAVLGNSPYATRDDVMRRMVRDALGAEPEFTGNVATEWGQMNEAGAILEFEMETGLKAEKARFVIREDWAGATVDAWVSDGGILECKCPYSLRNGGEFKPISVQEHYHDQIQFQLWVTDRSHAHFIQWKPDGLLSVIVNPSQSWRDTNLPILRQFYAEFLSELEAPDEHLAPRRVVVDTPEAAKALREWDEIAEQLALLNERKADLLADITAMAKGKDALIAGRKVTLVEKAGSVSYAKVVKAKLPDLDLTPWTGKPSSYWKIT